MRAVTSIDAAVFSGVGACRNAQRLIQFNMLTSVLTDEIVRQHRTGRPERTTTIAEHVGHHSCASRAYRDSAADI
ncbi:hypothetical protein Bsp3421_001625 [Burkholderia sp. FERM BP-3421]|nr:hypothetical protein Bsp3421_001625 [Burkholderia sp. FERM BP-3421]